MSLWVHVTSHVCAVAGSQVHAALGLRGPKVKRKTYDSACGKRVRLLGFPIKDRPEDKITTVWPPYVKDAQEWGYTRCPECLKTVPGRPSRLPLEEC